MKKYEWGMQIIALIQRMGSIHEHLTWIKKTYNSSNFQKTLAKPKGRFMPSLQFTKKHVSGTPQMRESGTSTVEVL